MKPKPYSLQFRFLLMQAGSMLLALWLVAGALYLSQYIHDRLAASLEDLRAELALNTQIHSSLEELSVSFWRISSSARDSRQTEYDDAARKLPELTSAYARMDIPADEKRQVEDLARMEGQLITRTSGLLARRGRGKVPPSEFDEVRRQNQQIRIAVRRIAESQLQRLQDSSRQLHSYTLALLVLLLAGAALAVAALGSFRHVHQHQLWAPIEELRRMVFEVRRGNLNIQGKISQSVELGPLMQAFVDMAGELREMRDSLELKVAERTAALQAAQNQLLQAAKLSALGQLVSGVAHEINNPLTSILGFSEVLLGRNDLGPGAGAQIQTIRDEALRLKNLVANLSSFARRGPQQTQRLDLRQLLARLVELRHYQLAANDIQLQFVPPHEPVWVEADSDQILQVLFNLTLNSEQAIKACRERGEIRLGCGVQGGRAWFEVADNGSGIPAALRRHIFDPGLITSGTRVRQSSKVFCVFSTRP
jgi:C4-dicarboxylate-specific signal transduction histidine kinase